VNAVRSHIANHEHRIGDNFPLNVEVVLNLVRRGVDRPIKGNGLRWQSRSRRRQRRTKWVGCIDQLRLLPRRRAAVSGLISLNCDRIVEQTEAGADRSLVIGEWIVRDSDSGIDVIPRGIFLENVRYLLKPGAMRKVLDGIQPVQALGWVGHELPASSEIDRELGIELPVVLNVGREFDVAIIPVRALAGSGNNTADSVRITGQEIGETSE